MELELKRLDIDLGMVVADAEAQCRFYGELLGLEQQPTAEMPGGMRQYRFLAGDNLVKLLALPKPPVVNKGGTDNAVGIRLLALLFPADAFDAMLARLDTAGHKHAAPVDFGPGVRIVFARDADGNMLELIGISLKPGQQLPERLQIGLTVSDLAATQRFYGELLGFTAEPPMPIGQTLIRYGYRCPKTLVKFWQQPQPLPKQTGAVTAAAGFRYFTFEVADLAATQALLAGKGIEIVSPPRQLGAVQVMFAADPDGNWIEFVQR